MGEEKLTLNATIYPGFKGGLKQLDALRTIRVGLQPLTLTTLDANQGLADEPQPYRTGVVIYLPDLPSPTGEGVSFLD